MDFMDIYVTVLPEYSQTTALCRFCLGVFWFFYSMRFFDEIIKCRW